MNLASRCRESISTLATLRNELVISKKSQVILENEVSTLRREVAVLRRYQQQQQQQHPNSQQQPLQNQPNGGRSGSYDIIRGSKGMMATGGVGMTLPPARGDNNNNNDNIVGDDNLHDNPMHEMIRTNSNNNASRR